MPSRSISEHLPGCTLGDRVVLQSSLLSHWLMDSYILSFLNSPQPPSRKSAAEVTFTVRDRQKWDPPTTTTPPLLLPLLCKAVIEYHIYYFPIHKTVSVASISLALSDFISSALDDLYSSVPLLSAKSAFVILGTLRTFKLITLSTFGYPSAYPPLPPTNPFPFFLYR